MRSKCQDVDVLYYPYACWTLTREEMSSHFPQPFTPTHWFRVNLLPQPFFTVANTFHLATWLQLHVYMFLFQSVVSLGVLCLIFQIKKWTSLHRSRCEVGGKSQKLCPDSAQRAICHISRIDEEQSLNASGKREMLKKVLIKWFWVHLELIVWSDIIEKEVFVSQISLKVTHSRNTVLCVFH